MRVMTASAARPLSTCGSREQKAEARRQKRQQAPWPLNHTAPIERNVLYGEATETQVWLDFSLDCGYMSKQNYDHLTTGYEEVGRMLSGMIADPSRFELKSKRQ